MYFEPSVFCWKLYLRRVRVEAISRSLITKAVSRMNKTQMSDLRNGRIEFDRSSAVKDNVHLVDQDLFVFLA